MKMFSISDLQRFSGVKAHTIRIWEKRYGVPIPIRTVNNTRRYTLEQTRLFLELVLLNQFAGVRISKLADMNSLDIKDRLHHFKSNEEQQARAVHRLILHMHTQQTESFEDLLNECSEAWDADALMQGIILPFLLKAPLLSYAHTDSTTHFAVTAIRQKIISIIDNVKCIGSTAPKALLFLPQGEHYDLVLLCLSYFLKVSGKRVLYLGTNVPVTELQKTALEKKPQQFYTYLPAHISTRRAFYVADFAAFLQTNLPEAQLEVVLEGLIESKLATVTDVRFTEVENLPTLFLGSPVIASGS